MRYGQLLSQRLFQSAFLVRHKHTGIITIIIGTIGTITTTRTIGTTIIIIIATGIIATGVIGK